MSQCSYVLFTLLVFWKVAWADHVKSPVDLPMKSSFAPQSIVCQIIPGVTPADDVLQCGDRTFYAQRSEGLAEEEKKKEHGEEKEEEAPSEGCEDTLTPFTPLWFQNLAMALLCVTCGATAAGLTLGMMGLDVSDLEMSLAIDLQDVPEEDKAEVSKEQSYARALLPVLGDHYFNQQFGHCMPHCCDPTNHHYLLVSLLLVNAAANEAMPIFLDSLVPEWLAVLLSVSLVLIFGEIIPSAIFTGPNQLAMAARLCPIVKFFRLLLLPLVWPISLILDKVLGHHEDEGFKHFEMKALMKTLRKKQTSKTKEFQEDEWDMMSGALDLGNKKVGEGKFMMPWKNVAAIKHDMILDQGGLADILHLNHSRLLVYKHNPADPSNTKNVVGLVLVKKLIGIDPNANKPLTDLPLRKPLVFNSSMSLLQALQVFQRGASHMALVTNNKAALEKAWEDAENDITKIEIPEEAQPVGVITLEDVIEEMLNDEIFDETDRQETIITLSKQAMFLNQRMRVVDRLRELARKARKTVRERKWAESRDENLVSNPSTQSVGAWTDSEARAWTKTIPRAQSAPEENNLKKSLLP